MYIDGRRRTASRPSRTEMSAASYRGRLVLLALDARAVTLRAGDAARAADFRAGALAALFLAVVLGGIFFANEPPSKPPTAHRHVVAEGATKGSVAPMILSFDDPLSPPPDGQKTPIYLRFCRCSRTTTRTGPMSLPSSASDARRRMSSAKKRTCAPHAGLDA